MESATKLKSLQEYLEPRGMEVYLFKVSWYNACVLKAFLLPYPDDTICAVVLTVPSFFEKAFLPYLHQVDLSAAVRDPIDSCIAFHITEAIRLLGDKNVAVLYDYELHPNRKPKILVQTAAHVAGAAFYYQRKHVLLKHCAEIFNFDLKTPSDNDTGTSYNEDKREKIWNGIKEVKSSTESGIRGTQNECQGHDPWGEQQKIFGVSIHPRFGGWFAMRCVMVFENLLDVQYQQCNPVDCVPSRDQRIALLNLFNFHWRDCKYRDVIPVDDKYSELQKKYFATLPKERLDLLSELKTVQR